MKYSISGLFVILILLLASCSGNQQNSSSAKVESSEQNGNNSSTGSGETKKPLSPRTNSMGVVGDTQVHIDYSSPSVRGRTIWGGLVAYDVVWVTGAHKATSIEFDDYLRIEGKVIPPGKYAFFTIPGKGEWTLILNENHEQHLADEYDEARDIIRITVVPERLEEPIESLTYEVEPAGDKKGKISVSWEHIKVSFSVEDV